MVDTNELINGRISELILLLKRMEDMDARIEARKDLHAGWSEAITALSRVIGQIQSKKVIKLETVRNVLLLINLTLAQTMKDVQAYPRFASNPTLKSYWTSLLSDLLDLSNAVSDLGSKF